MHYSGGTAVPAHRQPASGPRYPDGRVVSVQSVAGWLAEGLRIARANPVLWLVAILGCADFITLFELAPPFRILAVVVRARLSAGVGAVLERGGQCRPGWWPRE